MTMALGKRERGRQRPYEYRNRAMTPWPGRAQHRAERHVITTTHRKEHPMKHGHVTGTKTERTGASDWYKAIEAENLKRIEAAWQAKQATGK